MTRTDNSPPEGTYVSYSTTAATLIDVQGETSTTIKNTGDNFLPFHFFRFHPTVATQQNQGWTFRATADCPGVDMIMYYSFVNPLPNGNDSAGDSMGYNPKEPILVVADSKNQDVYVSLYSSKECAAVTISAYPMGETINDLIPDRTYSSTIYGGETQ